MESSPRRIRALYLFGHASRDKAYEVGQDCKEWAGPQGGFLQGWLAGQRAEISSQALRMLPASLSLMGNVQTKRNLVVMMGYSQCICTVDHEGPDEAG
jgi:hypothetical protein